MILERTQLHSIDYTHTLIRLMYVHILLFPYGNMSYYTHAVLAVFVLCWCCALRSTSSSSSSTVVKRSMSNMLERLPAACSCLWIFRALARAHFTCVSVCTCAVCIESIRRHHLIFTIRVRQFPVTSKTRSDMLIRFRDDRMHLAATDCTQLFTTHYTPHRRSRR